ncbi:DUF1801 domain-containing protein [Thalassospira sp.]|uniref:DUF1801 domain-containing protein n=1 Tax=Thalassospira sp. TaxID=1912094 RepID=UPI00311D8C37
MGIDQKSPAITAKIAHFPDPARDKISRIRDMIHDLAAGLDGVGMIEESLKWGEPAWRPISGSGTTIRADWKEKTPDQVMIFLDCKTDLIDRARSLLHPELTCSGNRAVIFALDQPLPENAIRTLLGWALTYHLDRKKRA